MIFIGSIATRAQESLKVDFNEVMRYLGVKKADDALLDLYGQCVDEAVEISRPKAVYFKTDISVGEGVVDFGFMTANSKNLCKNLCDCDEAYIFCATLGIGLDRQFEKLSKVSQAKATVFSAVASSLVENFCDYVNEELVKGQASKPRFSCGYGDFCIEHQRDILGALEADKRIGVYLNDSCMMVPVKTVTAVIGIRR